MLDMSILSISLSMTAVEALSANNEVGAGL